MEYQGDLQNNALAIFNRLPTDDKRTFLRRSLDSLWKDQIDLAQQGLKDVVIQIPEEELINKPNQAKEDLRVSPPEISKERTTLEELNAIEAVRFKNRLYLTFFILGTLGIGMVMFFTYYYGNPNGPLSGETVSNLIKLLELLLK